MQLSVRFAISSGLVRDVLAATAMIAVATLLVPAPVTLASQPQPATLASRPAPSASAGRPAPSASAGQTVTVDPAIPSYERAAGISGNLNAMGSDTLNNLMTLWAEGFQRLYPSVRIQIEGKGSSTAPPALISGSAQLGPMSRAMRSSEIDEFEESFGYPPTEVRVAIDALAVYVHKDNPIERLTLPQIDAIFSSTRAGGHPGDITTWGQLGLTGSWADRPISMYGRNSASGTYGYFKDNALFGGDYKETVKEQPGSASVVQGVTEDLAGIGYSGIGYQTSGVKTVAIARSADGTYYETDPETVQSGEYPLARFLYVYVNNPPSRPLDPLVQEFLRFVLSQEGQEVVIKDGYLPLSAGTVEQERTEKLR